MVAQGEVYDIEINGGRFRAVVVSADHHIATGHPPLCAPLLRQSIADAEMRPYVVALTDADSVAGAVQVGKLSAVRIPRDAVPVGTLSGASVSKIVEAACDLLHD